MAHLKLHLLGPFQLTLDGESLTSMRSDKVRALLAYLVVESSQPHRREKLAGLLWPDYPETSARASLRRALADLRKAIHDDQAQPPYLQVTRQTIRFDPNSETWIDVNLFTSLSKSNQPSETQAIPAWQGAADLYQGEFMEGFSLPDSPAFEEWLLLTRQHLRRIFLEDLQELASVLEERGEIEAALPYARRWVELEPLSENAQRQLMSLLALDGQREAALSQYQTYSQLLAGELGVEPSPETVDLYNQLLNREWPAPASDDAVSLTRQPRQIGESPYLGLSSFQEKDAAFFFGREDFTAELLSAVQDRQALTAILGASGSGKSSVAFAGLLPRLRESGEWLIAHLRPGERPFFALAGALLPFLESDSTEADRLIESQKLADALVAGDISLDQLLERVLQVNAPAKHLLLFFDQFEELYTLGSQPQLRQRFLDEVLVAAGNGNQQRQPPYAFLLTMRADFMGQALEYRPFSDTLQNATLMLGPMIRQELRAAIQEPAHVQGAAFEDGLVERILGDVGAEPGNLPLLEFALTLLWEQAQAGWLTHAGYEEIGHVRGALARHADQVYEKLDEHDRDIARRIFLQLVHPGEGTEDTRRIANRTEIGESNWPLVGRLADERLVVTGRDSAGNETVELVHEVLIANWDCLREWLERDRIFRTWQERLRASIRNWQTSGRDDGALLRGAPLVEAGSWTQERGPDLSQSELEFIQASLDLQDRRQAERERTRSRIVIALGIGLLVTLVLAIFAGLQWRQAEKQRNTAVQAQTTAAAQRDQSLNATSRLLAAQARNPIQSQYDLAMLLAVESVLRFDTNEGRSSLYQSLTHSPNLANFLHGHQADVRSLAFHPEGRLLASGSQDGQIILWDIEAGQPFGQPLAGHQAQVYSLSFSPDGKLLASGGFDEMVFLWDVDPASANFGQALGAPLAGHDNNIWSVAFSPDGRILASAGADREIILWDVEPGSSTFGQAIRPGISGHEGIITSLAFSPDGGLLASGSADKSILLWDVDTGEALSSPLIGHTGFVSRVAFSPDGRRLASAGKDNTIRTWDVDPMSESFGQPLRQPLTGHTDNIWGLAFNPGGDRLVSSGDDGLILVWDLDPASDNYGQPTQPPLVAHTGPVYSVAYSPDGEKIASAGNDRKVMLWENIPVNPRVLTYPYEKGIILAMTFSPDDERIAWTDNYGAIFLSDLFEYDQSTQKIPGEQLLGHTLSVNDIDFSPDGKMLASGSGDTTIILWDVDPNSTSYAQPVYKIYPPSGPIYTVYRLEFSPDGNTLAVAYRDGSIRFWDANRQSESFGQQLDPEIKSESGIIYFLQFSPDGQLLASSGEDNILRIWDTNPESTTYGQQLVVLTGKHIGFYNSALFSPNGKSLASVGTDNVIRIYDTDPDSATFGDLTGQRLSSQNLSLRMLDYSTDGRYLVSGDPQGTILLWDMDSRQALDISVPGMVENGINLNRLDFNPIGYSINATFNDGRILQWEIDLESWLSQACRRANRNLSREEWQRFFGDEPYRATCPDLPVD